MAYKLLNVEGTGAYGTVVKARDLRNDRRIVALKVLREDHLDNPRVLCRTRDEARLLSLLDHRHIVKVYGLDESWGRPVMVMEWLEAYSLGDLIDTLGRGLPVEVACQLAMTAHQALEYAWSTPQGDPPRPLGLVHRDLKPNNMLLTIHGELKLVDFGLAHGDFDGKESHTVSMVLGTRAYMAPERLDGAEDAPSADVYAVGLILYEMLHGRAMSLSLNPRHHAERLAQKLDRLRLTHIPEAAALRLRRLIAHLLAYEPEDRPSHAEAAEELQKVMAVGALSPDVHAFARQVVKPLVAAKRTKIPQEHEDWEDIAFLEEPVPVLDLRAPTVDVDPEVAEANDAQIRKILGAVSWSNHLARLRLLLEDRAAWTPAPFLEVLDRGIEGDERDSRRLAMCINLLRQRPAPEVVRRVRALAHADDDMVARTARQYLEHVRAPAS
jgi:serine/threonine protein kinase